MADLAFAPAPPRDELLRMLYRLRDALPELARAVAEPLSKTDKITVISNGAPGGTGAAKLTEDVTSVVAQLPAVVESLTGIDLIGALKGLEKSGGNGSSGQKLS